MKHKTRQRDMFLQEALKAYDKAIEIDPRSASAWFKKGELQIDLLGDFEDALSAFNKSTEIDLNLQMPGIREAKP